MRRGDDPFIVYVQFVYSLQSEGENCFCINLITFITPPPGENHLISDFVKDYISMDFEIIIF